MSPSLFLSLCLVFVSLLRSTAQRGGGGMVVTELWCVAKNNAEDAALQGALDWACGQGGVDCGPIQQGGPCYDPTDIQKTASYAFNNYYLKNGMTDDACSFSDNAALTSLNPSYGDCKFPSSKTVNNASISEASGTLGVGTDSADLSAAHGVGQPWLILALFLPFILELSWFLFVVAVEAITFLLFYPLIMLTNRTKTHLSVREAPPVTAMGSRSVGRETKEGEPGSW